MSYKVKNPYGQPKGSPVLTGIRRQELVDGRVNKDWYEDEIIPDEALSARQIATWVGQGVIKHMKPGEGLMTKITNMIPRR